MIAGPAQALPDAMNARTSTNPETPPRFDRKFIDEHRLLDRYLENKLPLKGARDFEAWCRTHPDYLEELKLTDRTQMSLKLLEAAAQPHDLGEPRPPWWKSPYLLIGLAAVSFVFIIATLVLSGKYVHVLGQLDDARAAIEKGSLVQPAAETTVRITPDRAQGIDRARIVVNRSAPQLIDVHIDLGYTGKELGRGGNLHLTQYRMFVDKQDQGRALILNNLLKDSNDELRLTLNSTGLAAGIYTARIEALTLMGGSSVPVGWLILEVR
jgi:hypothetical protein